MISTMWSQWLNDVQACKARVRHVLQCWCMQFLWNHRHAKSMNLLCMSVLVRLIPISHTDCNTCNAWSTALHLLNMPQALLYLSAHVIKLPDIHSCLKFHQPWHTLLICYNCWHKSVQVGCSVLQHNRVMNASCCKSQSQSTAPEQLLRACVWSMLEVGSSQCGTPAPVGPKKRPLQLS